jgi:L-rhamnose isomerase
MPSAIAEPTAKLRGLEQAGDFTGRLAMLEECKGANGDIHLGRL